MIRWIIETSPRLRYILIFGSVLLMVFGATQFSDMPVDVYPEFAPPRVEVQVLALRMTASDVEALITVPMEEALNGLEVIRSRSVPDLSDIILYFEPGTNLFDARLQVQERVRAVTTELPVWATSPFMIQPMSSTSRVMKIGFSTEDKSTEVLIDTALNAYWTVRPRLMRVPSVANVAIWGDRWDVVQVQADPERMKQHGVSLGNIMETSADALDVGMLKFSSGFEIGTGGFIDTPNQRLVVWHVLPALTPEEMSKIPLTVPEGSPPVALGDVATVVWGTQPMMNGDAVVNGDVGLMMIVEKLPWGNTLEVTRGVEEALAQMAPGLPGIQIDTTIFRPATFIEDALKNLGTAMIIGFALVALVLIIFLFEWRVAVISILSIPLSVIAAGLVLKFARQSINTMVLAGLVIALGVIVDDAIIDIENISGDDLDIIRQKAFEIKEVFQQIPEVDRANVDLVNNIPQLQVEVDLVAASQHGSKPGDVRRAVSAFIASEEVGDIWQDGKNYEVHVWSLPKYRNSINAVSDLTLEGKDGEHVRVGDLAKIEMLPTPNVILRENVSRRIDVFADVADKDLGTVAREMEKRLSQISFPLGYHAEMLGEYKEREAAAQRLRFVAIGALVVIFLLLQMAFGSWRLAVLVMVTLPFALVGGFLGTALDDQVISLGTLVGLLTIMGIAARNGILLISHCQHLQHNEGETFGPALVLLGARERLAPVLMTSLTSAAGILPLVVAGTVP